tara:strand:- start:19623 stop:20087 length:465 start_codon:yes stop_codon:yes gene_type:complete
MMGRCISATDFPRRQQRRFSNFVSPAGVHSSPNTSSIGPTVLTDIFPPSGHPIHPGLVSIPGSQSALETPVAASLDAASSLAGAPGGRVVERVGSDATASFYPCLTNRLQPASDPVREGADVFPRHGSHHEGNHAHEVVKACPEFGNVCRVFGN